MNKNRRAVVALAALALWVGSALAEELKSGPQVGKKVPGPFHPLNINGSAAGKKNCLYCQNGDHPVAMVFARSVDPSVTKLIKKIDGCTAKHSDCEMGSFVVFLSDKDGLEKELKDLVENEKINKTILSIDNPAGPPAYHVSQDADVTVVLYTNHEVKANFAFKKGELKDQDISKIVSDVKMILPEK
jgi:hypothetical protein